jgi:hypothetical protein
MMGDMKSQFENKDIIVPVVLIDSAKQGKSRKTQRNARVRINDLGIAIAVEGYGDATTDDGFGEPIFIEFHNGKLTVYVHADIQKEDPTHVIDMTGALETKRPKQKDDGKLLVLVRKGA